MLSDDKLTAAAERRRKIEDERRPRIFNARVRRIGIDKDAIDKQICERKAKEEEEKALENEYNEKKNCEAKYGLNLEKKYIEQLNDVRKDINDFRTTYQKFEHRREFDLNDPNFLKKSLPARISDDDPRCGPASAQKFEGEKGTSPEYLVTQRKQLNSWLQQQIAEKKKREDEKKSMDLVYENAAIENDRRALEKDREEKELRKKLEMSNREFNIKMALSKEKERQLNHIHETEDNQAEIYNIVTSDFYTEDPNQARSSENPRKIIGSRYKGMTKEELDEIYKTRVLQMQEKLKRDEEEKHLKKLYDEEQINFSRYLDSQSKNLNHKQKELKQQLQKENLKLSKEQKAHQDYLNNYFYRNETSKEFYDKFNTTTR